MTMWFAKFGDTIERLCGHPFAFILFTVGFIAGARVHIDATNIAISYITAALLLLTVGSARRSNKAMHVKLDDLEEAVDKANSMNRHIEDLTEQEIEEIRNGVGTAKS